MPEFLTLIPPEEARALLLSTLSAPISDFEWIDTASALGRVLAGDVIASQPLPDFQRSTADGYVVRSRDTHGASDSLPAYLNLIGEVPTGEASSFTAHKPVVKTGGRYD